MCKHDITDDSEGYIDQSVGNLEVPPRAHSTAGSQSGSARSWGQTQVH